LTPGGASAILAPVLLPLFPLPDVVHFPGTPLPLHIFEPRYRALVADLLALPERERRIGMVLEARAADTGALELFEPGTAGRLVAHEGLPDGRSKIVLLGEFRFAIEREVDGAPYRRAIVRRLPDQLPLAAPEAAESLRRELLDAALPVARETAARCGFGVEDLAELAAPERLARLVNRLAAGLDLPALRKQKLLAAPLAERAAMLAAILRSRARVLDALRPYRHLAAEPARQ
jgi:Lon protease-like protein